MLEKVKSAIIRANLSFVKVDVSAFRAKSTETPLNLFPRNEYMQGEMTGEHYNAPYLFVRITMTCVMR
jgi:hypothetical protein